jgi:hypothetical protein
MHVVLTCINNFQEYILTNIKQLVRLGHTSICIITDRIFFAKFSEFSENITLVAVEDLADSYNYNQNTRLDNTFRGGFWALTSARFFYLYEFMRSRDIENVIHLENDVLIYHNVDHVLDFKIADKTKIYLPFDTFTRNIASIMFIPNHTIFKSVLDKYDFSKNDMENFSVIQAQTGIIENFPIFISDPNGSPEYQFVTKNFSQFNMIFDAAAMGQYLGGVDPRNIPGDTRGFVNETCIIKYNQYQFIWNAIDGIKCPFIVVKDEDGNDCSYPIFNLHIHSKALENFI